MKYFFLTASLALVSGCATILQEPMVPISISMSDDSTAICELDNKRGSWRIQVPNVIYVRRSDDNLIVNCETSDGIKVDTEIPSSMGKIYIASALSVDFGIVDAVTDKHREYPSSFTIQIPE